MEYKAKNLARCRNIDDLRGLAKRRLPAPIFHFVDGGAEDEVTLRRNVEAFDDYEIEAEYAVDVSRVDTRTTVLGREIALPVMLSPTGLTGLIHPHGELCAARAAARAGTTYFMSCISTASIEDVGALHARAIKTDERGKVLGHRMTSQCASGSGQFIENIARYLGVPLEDVGKMSCAADDPEKVSSICAVLAETDVINMVARGISTENILKGIHLSIAGRLARLVRAVQAEGQVALTGGLTHDAGLVAAIRECLEAPSKGGRPLAEVELVAPEDGLYAGALGAAVLGAMRSEQLADLPPSAPAVSRCGDCDVVSLQR